LGPGRLPGRRLQEFGLPDPARSGEIEEVQAAAPVEQPIDGGELVAASHEHRAPLGIEVIRDQPRHPCPAFEVITAQRRILRAPTRPGPRREWGDGPVRELPPEVRTRSASS
jgi:hypothetical protein